MGLRFHRRIKLFPGVWFNLSKSGISPSIGGKGLTVNFKDGRTKTTISLPGTGLSYSVTSTTSKPAISSSSNVWLWVLLVLMVPLIFVVLII